MKIVCLCGSTKFKSKYEDLNLQETLKGNVVLSVGCFLHADGIPLDKEQKRIVDLLHLKKIEMADVVIVINEDDHIGESTARELAYAVALGEKEIRFTQIPGNSLGT